MFSFKGRINRTTFFLGNMIYACFALLIYLIPESSVAAYEDNLLVITEIILLAVMLLWIIVSLHIRRLHDVGLSGWFLPLTLIPFASVVLLFLPGKKSQQFGAKPTKMFDIGKLFSC